jgi:hypothetical protein
VTNDSEISNEIKNRWLALAKKSGSAVLQRNQVNSSLSGILVPGERVTNGK